MVETTIVIQAGGKSSRMGRDKGLVSFGKGTLLEFILAQVEDISKEKFIISNNLEAYSGFGLPVYPDVIPEIGALGGVYSALYHAKTDNILLLAVDMPFVNQDLIRYLLRLAEDADVVIPRMAGTGYLEPFRAIYSRRCLEPIKQMIDAGERKVISFFDLVKVRNVEQEEIAQYDPEGKTFMNVNTPQELENALKLLEES